MADDVRKRVLAAFVDAEPLTAVEVAIAAELPVEDVEPALAALCEADELRQKEVRGVDITQRKAAEDADVDLEAPIELYHRPAEELLAGIGTEDGAAADDADPIGRRLARMDVPGSSEMMRSWRRDAVRAAYEHLQERGPADAEALREAVFSAHQAGFDDPDAWWDCVRPRLLHLPGVAVEDDEWRVVEGHDEREG